MGLVPDKTFRIWHEGCPESTAEEVVSWDLRNACEAFIWDDCCTEDVIAAEAFDLMVRDEAGQLWRNTVDVEVEVHLNSFIVKVKEKADGPVR